MLQSVDSPPVYSILICGACGRIHRIPPELVASRKICHYDAPLEVLANECGGSIREMTPSERVQEAYAWQAGMRRPRPELLFDK